MAARRRATRTPSFRNGLIHRASHHSKLFLTCLLFLFWQQVQTSAHPPNPNPHTHPRSSFLLSFFPKSTLFSLLVVSVDNSLSLVCFSVYSSHFSDAHLTGGFGSFTQTLLLHSSSFIRSLFFCCLSPSDIHQNHRINKKRLSRDTTKVLHRQFFRGVSQRTWTRTVGILNRVPSLILVRCETRPRQFQVFLNTPL